LGLVHQRRRIIELAQELGRRKKRGRVMKVKKYLIDTTQRDGEQSLVFPYAERKPRSPFARPRIAD
jgi:hypothetical protein